MKSAEELRFAALLRAQEYCNDHDTDLIAITEYAGLKTNLDNSILKITDARAINIENISHFAENKSEKQTQMIDLIYTYQLRAVVKAHEVGNTGLVASLNFPKSYIFNNDDATVGVRAEEIKNIIKANLGVLTNITAGDVTNMEDSIQAYDQVLLSPKEAADHRKAMGTDRIRILLNEADIPKTMIGKLIHSYLPDLAHGWDIAIRVGTPSGVRHTSVVIRFTDAETFVPVINVKVIFTKGTETIEKYSNKLGYVRCYSMEVGTWSALAESEIYQTVPIDNIAVNEKKVMRYNLKLIKKNPLKIGGFNFTFVSQYTGKKLEGLTLKLPSTGKSYISDADGIVFDTDVVVNTYDGIISHNTIVTQNITFTITENNTTQMVIGVDDNP